MDGVRRVAKRKRKEKERKYFFYNNTAHNKFAISNFEHHMQGRAEHMHEPMVWVEWVHVFMDGFVQSDQHHQHHQ